MQLFVNQAALKPLALNAQTTGRAIDPGSDGHSMPNGVCCHGPP